MPPVIGLTTRSVELDGPFGVLPNHSLPSTYTTAVRLAGGVPVLIPTDQTEIEPSLLEQLDGLVLTGGGDLDPALYGRPHHPSVHGVDPERDRCEVWLATTARERRTPVLGICRGLQVINVAFGGDLVIDVGTAVTGAIDHRADEPGAVAMHPVRFDPASPLAGLLGPEVRVKSSHHQATSRLGEGLRAVAWAPDGVIEAIEAADEDWWCWGVQWHPEQRPPYDAATHRLFQALLSAAAEQPHRRNPQPANRAR